MTPEIYWLTLTAFLTSLFWMPYIINRLLERGVVEGAINPNADPTPTAPWAKRMMAAHRNAVENLVVFAPLVLAVHLTGTANGTTAAAAMVFFWARLAHFVVYSLGIPGLRTIAFATGFFAQAALALTVLGVL